MEADPPKASSKRWRVVGIVLKVILAVVVVALLVNAIGNVMAARAIERELAALRAAGMPTTVEEAFGRTVPDDRNAAATYDRAFAGIDDETAKELKALPRDPNADVSATLPALERIVAENADTLALLQEAATFPQCHWAVAIQPPAAETYMKATRSVFRGARAALQLLSADVCVALARGDSRRAVEDFRTAVALSKSLDGQHTIIAKLVQMVTQDQALWIFDRIMDKANVTPEERQSLAEGLSQMAASADLSETMQGELVFGRACNADMPKGWIFARPVLRYAQAHWLGYMRFVIEAARQPPWEGLRLLEERQRTEYAEPLAKRDLVRMWAHLMSPAIIKVFEQNAAILAKIDARRAALAHLDGRDADIPDPFTGKPLAFAETDKGFKFWSTGKDREDNGGRGQPIDEKSKGLDADGCDLVYAYRRRE